MLRPVLSAAPSVVAEAIKIDQTIAKMGRANLKSKNRRDTGRTDYSNKQAEESADCGR